MKTISELTYDPSGHMSQKLLKELPSKLDELFKKNLLIKLDTEDYEDNED